MGCSNCKRYKEITKGKKKVSTCQLTQRKIGFFTRMFGCKLRRGRG